MKTMQTLHATLAALLGVALALWLAAGATAHEHDVRALLKAAAEADATLPPEERGLHVLQAYYVGTIFGAQERCDLSLDCEAMARWIAENVDPGKRDAFFEHMHIWMKGMLLSPAVRNTLSCSQMISHAWELRFLK